MSSEETWANPFSSMDLSFSRLEMGIFVIPPCEFSEG